METFTDPRDGETYKIVRIGSLYWFAENLRYRGVNHYFPDRNSDNLQKHGCLYTWENAIKACPEGWRLPTKTDFKQLLMATGAYKDSFRILDSSWKNGYNSSGFSALPTGFRRASGDFINFGFRAYFWSTTPHDSVLTYIFCVESNQANLGISDSSNAFSVRYVKENPECIHLQIPEMEKHIRPLK